MLAGLQTMPPPLAASEKSSASPLHHGLVDALQLLEQQIRERRRGERPALRRPPRGSSSAKPERESAMRQAIEDEELAFSLFAQETASLVDARANDELLEDYLRIEEMDRYDHEVAVALSEGRDPSPPPITLAQSKRVWQGIAQQ
ncbi:hypothetical protein BV20DRAFT_502561 [Pilatotrama ljubarskyi]|nr:hypothetical protein BV20DRAFT_502561 [Pilatotrama ljubarskyi]